MSDRSEDASRLRREALGQAIRRHRGETPQMELAARLRISQASVSSWESGGVPLTVEQVGEVEAALGLRAGMLLVEAGYVAESLNATGWALALALRGLERAEEALLAAVRDSFGSPPGEPR